MNSSDENSILLQEKIDSGLLGPIRVNALGDISQWFDQHIQKNLPYDCAVIGKACISDDGIKILDILLHQGGLHDTRERLIAGCTSLLTIWAVMRQVCLLDLGACDCIGSLYQDYLQIKNRSFMVHGYSVDGSHIIFAMFSAYHWPCEDTAKQFLHERMPVLAQALECMLQSQAAPDDMAVQVTPRSPLREPTLALCLSARELEIITGLAEGKTNKEIARNLGTSPYTVRNQISRLTHKIGARNRTQAASLIALLHLGNPPEPL